VATSRKNSEEEVRRRFPPATDVESRENQLIGLAIDAAERELLKPHPSNQIVLHYLKLGTTKLQLEKEKIRKENILLESKANAINAAAKNEELYQNVIDCMKIYSGSLNRGDG
jgi:hypothetical protein